MKKRLLRWNTVVVTLIAAMMLLALVTMLDIERAQGVGLYLAMQAGQSERLPFDVGGVTYKQVTLFDTGLFPETNTFREITNA